jgi:DNA replication protein DnaC
MHSPFRTSPSRTDKDTHMTTTADITVHEVDPATGRVIDQNLDQYRRDVNRLAVTADYATVSQGLMDRLAERGILADTEPVPDDATLDRIAAAEQDRQHQAKAASRALAQWHASCPGRYLLATPALMSHENQGRIDAIVSDAKWIRNIWLWGDVGTGKTDLAAALARAFMAEGKSAAYVRWVDLAEAVNGYAKEAVAALAKTLDVWDVVVIDDYGTGRLSRDLAQRVKAAVEARNDSGKITIWTSNYPPTTSRSDIEMEVASLPKFIGAEERVEIVDLMQRAWDRIREDMEEVHLTGQSFRTDTRSRRQEWQRRATWWEQNDPAQYQAMESRLPYR